MQNGDFYVATFTDSGPDGSVRSLFLSERTGSFHFSPFPQFLAVSDLYLNSKVTEPYNDLSNPNCSYNAIVPPYTATQADGITSFSFCRLLVTGDTTCDHDILQNTSMEVLCAHGKSNAFGYHGPNRGFMQNYTFAGQIPLDTDSTGQVVGKVCMRIRCVFILTPPLDLRHLCRLARMHDVPGR